MVITIKGFVVIRYFSILIVIYFYFREFLKDLDFFLQDSLPLLYIKLLLLLS